MTQNINITSVMLTDQNLHQNPNWFCPELLKSVSEPGWGHQGAAETHNQKGPAFWTRTSWGTSEDTEDTCRTSEPWGVLTQTRDQHQVFFTCLFLIRVTGERQDPERVKSPPQGQMGHVDTQGQFRVPRKPRLPSSVEGHLDQTHMCEITVPTSGLKLEDTWGGFGPVLIILDLQRGS